VVEDETMTVAEILEQVKALSAQEYEELLAQLPVLNKEQTVRVPKSQTGAEIVAMLEQMEPIEFVDPEIEDPVEWVKAQRKKQADRLKPYWDVEP
jgi:hypothetical protein